MLHTKMDKTAYIRFGIGYVKNGFCMNVLWIVVLIRLDLNTVDWFVLIKRLDKIVLNSKK